MVNLVRWIGIVTICGMAPMAVPILLAVFVVVGLRSLAQGLSDSNYAAESADDLNAIHPYIQCLRGHYAGYSFEVSSAGLNLGSGYECDVVLPNDKCFISSRHCRIEFNPIHKGVWLRDEHTVNGTYFGNGFRATPGSWFFLNRGDQFFLNDEEQTMFQVQW